MTFISSKAFSQKSREREKALAVLALAKEQESQIVKQGGRLKRLDHKTVVLEKPKNFEYEKAKRNKRT